MVCRNYVELKNGVIVIMATKFKVFAYNDYVYILNANGMESAFTGNDTSQFPHLVNTNDFTIYFASSDWGSSRPGFVFQWQ